MFPVNSHIIETERLRLHVLTPDAYKELFESAPEEEIREILGHTPDTPLTNDYEFYQDVIHSARRSFAVFKIRDKHSGRHIGSCSYHTWILKHYRAEIGYHILQDEDKRRGYMTEAMKAIIQYGFDTMGLRRIEALVGPANIASQKLVKNLGFKQEGVCRQHYFMDDILHDSIIFSLLKDEWTSSRQTALISGRNS